MLYSRYLLASFDILLFELSDLSNLVVKNPTFLSLYRDNLPFQKLVRFISTIHNRNGLLFIFR